MRAIYIVCLIALLGAMMVTPAAATTWYVDDDGGYDYTSILDAMNAASEGDTIFVYNGTYGQFSFPIPNVRVIGECADVVTVDCNGGEGICMPRGDSTSNATGCVLDGFTVVNSPSGLRHGVYGLPSPNCVIRNCVFDGMTASAGMVIHGDNTTFENNIVSNFASSAYGGIGEVTGKSCTFVNNTFINIPGSWGALYIRGGSNFTTIDGNTFINCTGSRALILREVNNCVVVNNTFIDNAGDAIRVWKTSTVDNIITRNNITSNGGIIYLKDAGDGNKIYLNDFVDNAAGVTYFGTPPTTTYWNSTEPIEYTHGGATRTDYLGNYWGSDYTGGDGDGDGIGDTAYDIHGSATDSDHRPLMEPFENYPEVPAGAADPDLTPTSIATDSLSAGVPAAITVNVSNIGSAEAGSFNVSLKVEETVIGSDTVASLGAGGSVPVVFTWTPDAAGSFNLTAIVDSDDAVAESDEANNGLTNEVTVTPAAATTWYVDDDGGYDFTTIGGALNAASDGDTIFVYNGTYGADSIYIEKPNLTVIGEGADVVTWVALTSSQFIHMGTSTYSASGSILDGLTVVNSETGIKVTANSPNCIIRNCVFDGMTAGEACQLKGDNITFENNVILNPACEYAALCVLGDYCTIINNTIEGNTGAGISLELDYPKNNVVTKNNLISNAYAGIELYDAGEGNKIYLNNFVDNGVTVTTSGTTAPSVTYWNSTEPIEYTYNGNPYTNYLGNYWGSDYTGSDGDGDGLGAPPYTVPDGLGEDHHPLMTGFENYLGEEAADPDLTPTSIATDSLSAGVPAAITVNVSNIGSAEAGSFNVTLKVEDTVIGSDTVASLGAGSSVPVIFTWTPDAAGSFNLTAIADSDDAVAESDETNNERTNEVTVTPAAATTWDVYPDNSSDSIRNTINSASDGDTIFFHAGTYVLTGGVGDWRLLVDTPNITLKGEGVDVVTLDGMGKPVIYIGAWEASPGCVVEGFRIVNGSVGVAVANAESPNCIIRNNVFDGMSTAIGAAYSPNTTIKGNVIDGLSKYIEFRASPVTFVDNVVSNSTKTYASVKFYIPDAVIVNNTFINNVAGMGIYNNEATNITVVRNNFISSGAGIKLYGGASGNRIYLNNFVDNTESVSIGGSGTPANIWNSTEPIEYTHNGVIHTGYLGNYWSDYTGEDTSPEDGIGDDAYQIAASTDYDYRPLMESFENYLGEEAADPDLTPTSIANDSLSAGVPAAITVNVSNIGSGDAGSFNVSLKVEDTVIGSDTVASLGAGSSVPVVFTWTPDAAGSFNLTAIVDSDDAVAESDEANNGLTNEVTVTPATATTWDVYSGDSIQDALNSASSGDTVFVHAGTYYESGSEKRLYINKPNITLKGEGADLVTLDRGGGSNYIAIGVNGPPDYSLASAHGCIVEGFRITNCSSGVCVYDTAPNCIIRNNVFEDISNQAVSTHAPNTTIMGNVIDGGEYAIYHQTGVPITFVDNVISNTTKTTGCVRINGQCSAVISNNTILKNNAGGIALTMGRDVIVTKNNVSSNGKGIWVYKADGANKIYLNNFVDNTVCNVAVTSSEPQIWNFTEPITYTYNSSSYTNYLGNYWGSDYTGGDGDGDGLGDVPYDIPGSATDKDHRPLMAGFENYVSEEETAPTPATSFLISGYIDYDNGNPVLNPTVTVRNVDTSEDFTVKTDAGSNYYRVLTDSSHVSAGNAIFINASDGTVYNRTIHIVTASEIEIGGFMQDMILDSGDKPDLIVTEMSGEWVSLSTYNITYTVKNNGSMAADASTTSTRIDGTEVATEPMPALVIGESHTSTVGPFTLSGDNDTIEVCADSGNVINELDETNNCLSNLFEAPGIPDLIVWGIAKTPGDVSEENILGVRVKNIGTANAGSFDVSLSIDGTQVLLETVTSLAAGETTELEYTWTPAGTGEYALSAAVDTNNDVEESDETNNDYARTSVIIKPTDWAQFNYDASGIGFSPSGAPSSDTVKWISENISAGGGLSWDGSSDMGPVVAGGKIFTYCGMEGFSSTLYDVACLDEETGELLWQVSLPYSMAYGSWAPLGYDDGMVFCTVNHYVVALDADDGSIVWECDLDSPEFAGHAWSVNSGPTIADGKVFAGTYDEGGIGGAGGLAGYVAIDEYTGEKLWQTTGDGHCDSTPAYYDGVVYAGFDRDWTASPSGGCYALNASTGEEVWTTWLPFSVWGSVSVDEDYVYGANYNFYGPAQVFILYRNNGTVKVISESLRTDSTPAVAYDNIYICGGCTGYSDTGTFCVDKETLEVIWSAPAGSWTASPAVADGKVYVGGFCYDAFTGEEIFSYEQGGLSPVIANGYLFNVQNGKVVCFEDILIDLTVSAIETPANLRSDVINPITATIKNLGGFDAGSFDVSLAVDGIPVDTASVTSLAVGENTTVEFLWTPSSTGNQALTVTADASDAVTESDESNNNRSQTADVLEKLTVTANVRIEGKNDTGWTGDVTFSNSTITASDGSIHYLNEPTALGALDEADRIGGFGYVAENSVYGLYVSEINNEPPIGWDGWMYRVNYMSPPFGAPDYTLADNDEVLWYFGIMWPLVPPLAIELDRTTVMAEEEFTTTVTAYNDTSMAFEPVDGANVYIDGMLHGLTGTDGTLTISLEARGTYQIHADKGTWADYTRSNRVDVDVTALKVDIGDYVVTEGSSVVAPITVYGIEDYGTTTLSIEYNPSVAWVTSVDSTPNSTVSSSNINNPAGIVTLTAWNTDGVSGDIVIAYVTFEARGSSGSSSPLNLSVSLMGDTSYNNVPTWDEDGSFTVWEDIMPVVGNPQSSPDTILNDNGRARMPGTNLSTLSVSVIDNAGIASVTIDLSSIGGDAAQPMTPAGGTIWSVVVNATDGINKNHYLSVNATDTSGNSNTDVSVPLTVLRRGDVVRDGDVDHLDAYYIARYCVGLEPAPDQFVADVVRADQWDGVDIVDAFYIARHSVGLEPAP